MGHQTITHSIANNSYAEFIAVLDSNRRLDTITVQDAGKDYSHIKLDILLLNSLEDNTKLKRCGGGIISGWAWFEPIFELGASKIVVRKSFVSNEYYRGFR